jgi:hypothetical protein
MYRIKSISTQKGFILYILSILSISEMVELVD